MRRIITNDNVAVKLELVPGTSPSRFSVIIDGTPHGTVWERPNGTWAAKTTYPEVSTHGRFSSLRAAVTEVQRAAIRTRCGKCARLIREENGVLTDLNPDKWACKECAH